MSRLYIFVVYGIKKVRNWSKLNGVDLRYKNLKKSKRPFIYIYIYIYRKKKLMR